MKLENLDKALKASGKKIEDDLKSLIVAKGHKGNGKLLKSITVKVSQASGDYNIEIDALKYIQYLDNGDLLKNFLSDTTKKLEKIISDEVQKDIKQMLTQLLK